MKRIFLAVALLFLTATMHSAYNVGAIDSVDTTSPSVNNGGTGYGNATQADAVGFVMTAIATTDNIVINGSAIQPDGKTVVVGVDSTTNLMIIARYNINGTLDTTFGSEAGYVTPAVFTGTTAPIANAVTVLPNGKIVVVGTLTVTAGTRTAYFVAQFTSAGALDTGGTFAGAAGYAIQNITANSLDIANAVAVDSSGNIYVVGTSNQLANTDGQNIFAASYSSAGVLRTGSYNSGAVVGPTGGSGDGVTIAGIGLISMGASGTNNLAGYGAAIDSSGKLVVVGSSSASSVISVARFTTAGILDTGFNTDGYNTANLVVAHGTDVGYAVGFQSATNFNRIIVAGTNGTAAVLVGFESDGDQETSGFGISSNGYIVSALGGTSAIARSVAIQSNDKIVVGGQSVQGGVTEFSIARFLANGSALDTTTFAAENGYTNTVIDSPTIGNTMSMQQNGSFVVAGTVSAAGTKIGVARYLGDIPQGAIDYTYNPAVASSPGTPGYRTYPTVASSASATKPQVVGLQAMLNNNVYVVSKQTVTTVSSSIAQLSSAGATVLSSTDLAQAGASDVVVDSQQRALVVGTNATPKGWLYRTTSSASLVPSFTTVVETTNSSSFTRVAEQSLGRIVVIGQGSVSSAGLLIAYTEAGLLASTANTTTVGFGTGGPSSFTGFNTMATAVFNDVLIDSSNNIYVAYQNNAGSGTGFGNICIAKYLPDGSGLDTTFGTIPTGGIVDTGLPLAVLSVTTFGTPCMSFDTAGNLVIAAVATAPATITNPSITTAIGDIVIQKYSPTVATSTPSSSAVIRQTTTLLTTPILTKLQCDSSNRLILNGYENAGSLDFFVGRCGAGVLTLDTTFAPYSSCPGILKTMYSTNDTSRVSNSVAINYLGNILFGGYENIDGSNTVSLVSQVIGDTTTPSTQVARFPSNFGLVSGSVNLNTTASLPNGHPQSIYTIASGTFAGNTLVADSGATDTTLAMLNSSYAVNGAFGGGDGLITLTGLVSTKNIMLDVAGNIYVTGNSSTDVVVYKVTPTGTSATAIALPEATAVTGLTAVYSIAQQASGRILIAGYNSFAASGVILSYNPVTNIVDTSFNQSGAIPGYWFTGVAYPITSISVATSATLADKIYFAYQGAAAGAVVVNMLLENGSLAPALVFTPISAVLTPTSDTVIAMKLDVNGDVVLVVQTSAGIRAVRYNADGSVDVAVATIIPAATGLALDEIVTLSDGTTLILAQSGASSPFSLNLAQLTSTFILNAGFNPLGSTPGILTTTVSPQVEFFAVDVLGGSAGIIVSGDTNATAGSATPYLTQISNGPVVTKVSQTATTVGTAGTTDVTFNAAAANPGFMNLNTAVTGMFSAVIPGTTTVKSLLQNDNGSYYVAGDNGTNTYMVFMSADDVQNTSFGTSGLLTIASQANLAMMLLAQDGGFYAVGGSGSAGSADGWINYLNASTGAAISGFTPTATLDGHFAIAQQPEGRLLVAGILDGVGTVIAYDPLTGAVDTTFNETGDVPGYYTATGYTAINSIVADLLGNVYVIANDASNNATAIALDADGTTVLWDEVVTANSTLATTNYVTFNQVVDLVAVAVNTTANTIVVKTYTLGITGGGTAVTTLTLGASGVATGITSARVTSVSVDLNASPGKILLTGYDSGVTPNVPFIIRTSSAETGLDTTFTAGVGTAGVVKTILPTGAVARWYDLMINANGKISAAGYNTISSAVAPYMIRVYGDEFIGQFDPEVIEPMADDLNTDFGTDGIAFTPVIADLLNGGSTVVDSQNRILIGGVTTTGGGASAFTVARFTSAGVIDTTFSSDGVATSGTIASLTRANGSYIAVDSSDNVYIAGITDTPTFVVAKFLGTTGALDTAGFNAGALYSLAAGITQSPTVANLNNGGYVAIDYLGNVLVGGSGSDLKLSVARFTSAGIQDTLFSTDGLAQTSAITNLTGGGFVATDSLVADADNSVYLGGATGSDTLIVAKFNNVGVLATYGTSGIATTTAIANLTNGGGLALDINKKAIIGGYTSGKTFVAARFTTAGVLDSASPTMFGTAGIATSNALTSLESNPNLFVDSNNNTLLGGLFTAYDGVSKEMVMARFTATGAIDTTFTSNGLASTGIISGLQTGGFVAANSTTNPFLGGYAGTKLVVAEILSGAEIIIVDPAVLQGAAFSVYWYGSNPAIYEDFFSVEFYAGVIADATAKAATIAAVNASFDLYTTAYQDQANYNLAASTTPAWDAHFDAVQAALIVAYSGSTSQINAFFTNFNARRLAVRNTLLAYNS